MYLEKMNFSKQYNVSYDITFCFRLKGVLLPFAFANTYILLLLLLLLLLLCIFQPFLEIYPL